MHPRKFYELFRVSFRESFAYRVNAVTRLISSILFLVAYFFVWQAIGASGQLNSSLTEVMTYLIMGQVVSNTSFVDVESFIGHKIHRGTITNELKRPVSIFTQAYFNELGKSFFYLLTRSLPIGILGIAIVKIALPGFTNAILFLLALFFSFNIVFLLSYTVAMGIFWTKIDWALRSMRNHVQKLFAGVIFPLYLVPEQFKIFFDFLPFQAMVDGPIRIFLTQATGKEALMIILNQIFWITILFLISHIAWKKAKTKLTVQGG